MEGGVFVMSHSFDLLLIRRCLFWIQRCGSAKILNACPLSVHGKFYLCSEHFCDSQFAGQTRRRLKENSYPLIFSHPGLSDADMKEYVGRFTKCFAACRACMKPDDSMPSLRQAITAQWRVYSQQVNGHGIICGIIF